MDNSRALTQDAINIIKQALTESSLHYSSEQFTFNEIQVTPNCIQQPHPPLWMATVSPDSFQIAAQLGVNAMCGPFKPWFMIKQDIKRFKQAAQQHARPLKTAMTVGFYCHEDGEQAKRIAKPAMEWFYRQLFHYTRPILKNLYNSYDYYYQYRLFQSLLDKLAHYSVLEKLGYIIVGDPENCRNKFLQLKQAGVEHVIIAREDGGSNSQDTRQCMQLTHDEITPNL